MHKILLVEDDETIRQQVKKIMEQWGFEVIAVDDFMDVLGTFVQTNPHLILMDIDLTNLLAPMVTASTSTCETAAAS